MHCFLILLCSYEDERIEPLPANLLPLPNPFKRPLHKTPSSSSSSSSSSSLLPLKQRMTSKKKKNMKLSTSSSSATKSGLEATVLELLADYQPSSSEHKPLWCRICRFQASSEEDFFEHKSSPLHLLASKKEREMSYCSLCRKQFTSPAQRAEHAKGKWHLDRLERRKSIKEKMSNGKVQFF